jgi:hypothetical protein
MPPHMPAVGPNRQITLKFERERSLLDDREDLPFPSELREAFLKERRDKRFDGREGALGDQDNVLIRQPMPRALILGPQRGLAASSSPIGDSAGTKTLVGRSSRRPAAAPERPYGAVEGYVEGAKAAYLPRSRPMIRTAVTVRRPRARRAGEQHQGAP